MRDTAAVLEEFPELITMKELQVYLRCSHEKAWRIVNSGKGFAYKIGGTWYIDKQKFLKWMNKECKV